MITCSRGHKFWLAVGDNIDTACPACTEEGRLKEALLAPELTCKDARKMLSEALIALNEQGTHSGLIAWALKEVEARKM